MKNLVYKFTFDKHQIVKNKLLDLIEKTPYININDNSDSISKTDYFITNYKKEYISFIQPYLKEFMKESLTKFKLNGFEMDKIWFQQYHKNDNHKWHTHKYTNLVCVYYVELAESHHKTEIKDFNYNNLIEYDAKEGDIIMFPAFLYHSSPVISTNNRKTVLSFHLNIT
jgi:hypothetical protein